VREPDEQNEEETMSAPQADPRIQSVGEVMIRLRMGGHDGHYAGGLVDGARMLQLFGDVATELLIRLDGDEGLFRAYESVEFLAPVYVGDYIEAVGRIVSIGKSSRKIEFSARKVVLATPPERGGKAVSSAEFLAKPVEVCRATGTCVTPVELQRGTRT
jgi:3-aminobutyryl-CoA ammonia-lyase